jgi:putative DNA primase/helicase
MATQSDGTRLSAPSRERNRKALHPEPAGAEEDPLLGAALDLASRGIPVFPVTPQKVPLTAHGFKDASMDPAQIRSWWTHHPRAGIGVPTGPASGLVVVDLDPRNGSEATVRELERKHGAFPATVTSRTGSGGTHFFFNHPGRYVKGGSGKLGPGVDLKGDGGYVVVPPSSHESGGRYAWFVEHSLGDLPLADLPAWILNASTSTTPSRSNGKKGDAGGGLDLAEGERNDGLASLAGSMRRRGMSGAAICAALLEENQLACSPPLPEDEVRRIAASVSRYAPEAPISAPPTRTTEGEEGRPIEEPHFTDTGNADRFVRDHAGDVLFCHPWNRWLVWDGVRWTRDERGEIARRVRLTVRGMHEDAGRLVLSDDERKRLAKHALASESERARKAMLELAKCELPVHPDDLDADPWLLNAHNGTIHLRDGKLYEHSRGNRITKACGTLYDPGAECPRWLAFLERIFAGNAELIAYVQRALGYSLTGDTREEAFFVAHGSGANGKSTLFGVVLEVLGDYGLTTRAETVLSKRNPDAIPNDVAALAGARFVTAIEAEEGRRLASGLVKSMTGRDKLSARFMRGEWFEFVPSFKLWLGVNHKPRIPDSSPAMWRRVKLIPFTVTIPEPERDPELRNKLMAESPGILAWLVRGAVAWKGQGLGSCAAVDEATRSYRDESNLVAEWAALACDVRPGAKAKHTELYSAFRSWCEQEGEETLGPRAFGDRLEGAFPGVKRGKVDEQRGFRGIQLTPPEGGF